jgi:glutaredoxin 3
LPKKLAGGLFAATEENDMAQRRKIEIFTAGCPCCTEAVELVKFLAGTEHDIEILDMHDPFVAAAASGYGIRRLPAVVIDGQLADRCAGHDLNEVALTRQIVGGHGFKPFTTRRS